MFHNYFFLKRLSSALDKQLKGLSLVEAFSQNKNELLLAFATRKKEVWVRANLDPQVGLLHIPEDFRRAKKNSVDLFSELLDLEVTEVEVFQFERSFLIRFTQEYQLVFKMHASRSNIILVHKSKPQKLFRSKLPNDTALKIEQLHQSIPITFEHFSEVEGQPSKFIPALGKEVRTYLYEEGYESLSLEGKWETMQKTLEELDSNPISIYYEDIRPRLSLLNPQNPALKTFDPIEATNTFYEKYTHYFYLGNEKHQIIKSLESNTKKTKNYISNSERKLNEVKNRRSYEELANIIMANLHQISKGEKSTTLTDFYNDSEVTIKLNPNLSPQKNAENLYRKSKNQKIEIEKLQENISQRESQLLELEEKLNQVKETEDFKTLRKQFSTDDLKKEEPNKPYNQFAFHGYDILIGKNAKANDQLTLKVANKEDYWLHARDVAGSHVVVRHQAGKNLPKDVLERAAEIAAWHSKRKTDSLCPVIYTQKKYVRKAKGSPPGLVIVEKEEVIMVKPKGL